MMQRLLDALRRYRFDASTEAAFQLAVERALKAERIGHEREVRLSARDRIDFLCAGGVGLELKIKGSESAALRQLLRYAESERVTALVVCTTRSVLAQLPGELLGKPVAVHLQGGLG